MGHSGGNAAGVAVRERSRLNTGRRVEWLRAASSVKSRWEEVQ